MGRSRSSGQCPRCAGHDLPVAARARAHAVLCLARSSIEAIDRAKTRQCATPCSACAGQNSLNSRSIHTGRWGIVSRLREGWVPTRPHITLRIGIGRPIAHDPRSQTRKATLLPRKCPETTTASCLFVTERVVHAPWSGSSSLSSRAGW